MIHIISTEKRILIQEASFSQKRFIAQRAFDFQAVASWFNFATSGGLDSVQHSKQPSRGNKRQAYCTVYY